MKALIALLLCASGIALAAPAEPQLKVALKKHADSAVVATANDSTIITIQSPGGIGAATLTRTRESWPAHLVLHLKLTTLESFTLNNGLIRFHTTLKSPARVPFWKADAPQERADTAAGTLDVPVKKLADAIEIDLPKEILADNPKEIQIRWIDAFRN